MLPLVPFFVKRGFDWEKGIMHFHGTISSLVLFYQALSLYGLLLSCIRVSSVFYHKATRGAHQMLSHLLLIDTPAENMLAPRRVLRIRIGDLSLSSLRRVSCVY